MKRYSHAAYPNSHRLEENPTGEWVRWEDVGVTLKAVLSRAETAEQANKALMDERAVIIRTHRDQLERMQREITDLKDELHKSEESADRYREEAHHADMLRD